MYAETGVSRSPAISKGAFIRFLASNHADNKKPIPGHFRRWVLATLESFRESLGGSNQGPLRQEVRHHQVPSSLRSCVYMRGEYRRKAKGSQEAPWDTLIQDAAVR